MPANAPKPPVEELVAGAAGVAPNAEFPVPANAENPPPPPDEAVILFPLLEVGAPKAEAPFPANAENPPPEPLVAGAGVDPPNAEAPPPAYAPKPPVVVVAGFTGWPKEL